MEELLNQLFTLKELVLAELAAAIPVAAALAWKYIKGKLGPARLETLGGLARVAVFAAEELGHKGGKVNELVTGRQKLEFAVGRLRDLAARAGVKVTDEEAKNLVEAVLNEVRPYTQLPDLSPPIPVSAGARDPEVPAFEPAH
jgi:glutamine synthetase type III